MVAATLRARQRCARVAGKMVAATAWGTEMCEGREKEEFNTNHTNLLFGGWAREKW